MLHNVYLPSDLVAWLRAESGLSQRELSARAGCTRSTIVRIESGEMDPTVTMLARIAAAAGCRLSIEVSVPDDGPRLATAAVLAGGMDAVDWTRLRGILDWLRLHPDEADQAISDPPRRTDDPAVDNLLAAIAEKIADDAECARPRWAARVPPLSKPWSPPGTPRMQSVEAASAPTQFKMRNLLIAVDNLWRID